MPGDVVDEHGRKLHSVSLRDRQPLIARKAQRRWYLQSLGRRPFRIAQPPLWGLSTFFLVQLAIASLMALGALGWVTHRAWITSQQPDFALLPWAPKAGLAFIALLMASGCLAYAGFAAVLLRQSYGPRRVREFTIDEQGLAVVLPGGPKRFLWRDLRSANRLFSVLRLTFSGAPYVDIPAQLPATSFIDLITTRVCELQRETSPRLGPLLRRRGGIPIAAMLAAATSIAIGLPAPEHMTKFEHASFAITIALLGAVFLATVDLNGGQLRLASWDQRLNRRIRFWWRRRRAGADASPNGLH